MAPGSIYIDTNIFIYAVEGTSETAAPSRRLIETLAERRDVAMTSEITLAELLAPTARRGALPLHLKRRLYLDLLVWRRAFLLAPVSRSLLIATADLRSVVPLKLPDAIHLQTAIQSKCSFFVGEDRDLNNLPSGMELVRPNAQQVEDLLSRIT